MITTTWVVYQKHSQEKPFKKRNPRRMHYDSMAK